MTQERRKDDKLPEGPLVFTDRNLTAAGLAHLEAERASACLVHAKDDVWVGVGTKDALRGLLWEDAAPQAGAGRVEVPPDFPAGAMQNGEVLADRLEIIYDFQCEAGPLRNCSEWVELRHCFSYMAEYLQTRVASPEAPVAPDALLPLPTPWRERLSAGFEECEEREAMLDEIAELRAALSYQHQTNQGESGNAE